MPTVQMLNDKARSGSNHFFRKNGTQHLSLVGVLGDIDRVNRVILILLHPECQVKLAPADIGLGAVDAGICIRITEDDSIGLDTHPFAVGLEMLPEPDVAITAEGVVI
jgi:hypothetical protein